MVIVPGDTVTIEYTGRLPDGTVFDTTREDVAEETGIAERQPDRSFEPLTHEVAADEVIIGIDATLIGMEAGQKTTAEIPPPTGRTASGAKTSSVSSTSTCSRR